MEKLQVETAGKGLLTIELEKCDGCLTKACIGSCPAGLFRLEGGRPALAVPRERFTRACTDCLACEFECSLRGAGALRIVYPMPEMDEYVRRLESSGLKPVWRR